METYRHALYRYSTGQGFNVNVDLPQEDAEVASYKMMPLYATLITPETAVNVKREADRISMQYEAAMQQIKVLGYDPLAGKRMADLKARTNFIKYLMVAYTLEYIIKGDLDKLYDMYINASPDLDKTIIDVVNKSKKITGIDNYQGKYLKMNMDFPYFDRFGKRLTKTKKVEYNKDLKKDPELAGFDQAEKPSWIKLAIIGLVLVALTKLL